MSESDKGTTLMISCDATEEKSGPTVILGDFEKDYRVSPELTRILQEAFTKDKLSDHETGVQYTAPPAHVLQVLQQHGFNVTGKTAHGDMKLWTVSR